MRILNRDYKIKIWKIQKDSNVYRKNPFKTALGNGSPWQKIMGVTLRLKHGQNSGMIHVCCQDGHKPKTLKKQIIGCWCCPLSNWQNTNSSTSPRTEQMTQRDFCCHQTMMRTNASASFCSRNVLIYVVAGLYALLVLNVIKQVVYDQISPQLTKWSVILGCR